MFLHGDVLAKISALAFLYRRSSGSALHYLFLCLLRASYSNSGIPTITKPQSRCPKVSCQQETVSFRDIWWAKRRAFDVPKN